MAERSRRIRRQISEITEDSPDNSEAESEDFDPRKSEMMRRAARQEPAPSPRAKRNAGNNSSTSPQTTHSLSSDSRQSIKLTMKVAPSKLREVMRATELESLQDTLGGGKVIDAPRSSRRAQQAQASTRVGTRPKYAEVHESDVEEEEEDEEEELDGDGDEDDEEEEEEDAEDTTMNDFDEVGAEAEGDTDDEDVEMDEQLPPVRKAPTPPKGPKITLKTPARMGQAQLPTPKVIVTPANVGPVLSVEDQEMRDEEPDDDDEEEEDDITNVGDETNLNDEDAEGEEEPLGEEVEGEEIDEEEDDDLDSDDDDDDEPGSGAGTPDPSKMTSRQRGRPVEPLMALDMAPQQRKFFTDEEKAMKKDEHARKRKELTKRKTQEEKTAALNRLLKPQVSKTRGAAPKAETLAAQMQAAAEEEEIEQRADPHYTRWISSKGGVKLGVPEEWLGKQVGRCFGPPLPPSNGALVQELD